MKRFITIFSVLFFVQFLNVAWCADGDPVIEGKVATTVEAVTVTTTGAVSVDDTTDASSTTTGSIHTDGGLGVAKKSFFGDDVTITGSLNVTGAQYKAITTPNLISNTYTIEAGQYTVLFDDDDAQVTDTLVVALPEAASNSGRILNIKKIGSSHTVQLDGNGSETVDGALTLDLTIRYEAYTLQSDGTNWIILP